MFFSLFIDSFFILSLPESSNQLQLPPLTARNEEGIEGTERIESEGDVQAQNRPFNFAGFLRPQNNRIRPEENEPVRQAYSRLGVESSNPNDRRMESENMEEESSVTVENQSSTSFFDPHSENNELQPLLRNGPRDEFSDESGDEDEYERIRKIVKTDAYTKGTRSDSFLDSSEMEAE